MSYDLKKAKQFMEAMKENDEQIAQEWNEYVKRQLNAIFGTGACYVGTDMVDPHNLGALPRNSGRYPWEVGDFDGDVPCINKEALEKLYDLSWIVGSTAMEYLTDKDGEKIREYIGVIEDRIYNSETEELAKNTIPIMRERLGWFGDGLRKT